MCRSSPTPASTSTTCSDILALADGVIIGTHFKRDGGHPGTRWTAIVSNGSWTWSPGCGDEAHCPACSASTSARRRPIGILIRTPRRVTRGCRLATCGVALRKTRLGGGRSRRNGGANVGEIARELRERRGRQPASEIAAVGRHRHVAGARAARRRAARVLRPSIQQSDARCGREVEELKARGRSRSRFCSKTGNGVNQQLIATKLRWIERHEPDDLRAHRDRVRLLRLYQLAPDRRARH